MKLMLQLAQLVLTTSPGEGLVASGQIRIQGGSPLNAVFLGSSFTAVPAPFWS